MFGLQVTTPIYRFGGVEQCSLILDQALDIRNGDQSQEVNDYIIFLDLDERSFHEYFESCKGNRLSKSWIEYDHYHSAILIRMESKQHAAASMSIHSFIDTWALSMSSILIPTSTAHVRSATRTRKPDCAWQPEDLPPGRDELWPSIVVEVVWTETRANLEDAMKFWLHESGGQVKAAISLSVTSDSNIIIERWSLRRMGKARVPVPFPVDRMEIEPRPGRPARITGCIKISFQDVFLRPRNRNESHLVFEGQGLETMAKRIKAAVALDHTTH